jgi:hypothetical protein
MVFREPTRMDSLTWDREQGEGWFSENQREWVPLWKIESKVKDSLQRTNENGFSYRR